MSVVINELFKKKADVNVKNMAKGDALIYAVVGKDERGRHPVEARRKSE
ncbi:MAG: hypothetical protein MZV70_43555 [Desulfobacterales bacterium]|nr:hypothetical protein [Desulfobacterales bacterium]